MHKNHRALSAIRPGLYWHIGVLKRCPDPLSSIMDGGDGCIYNVLWERHAGEIKLRILSCLPRIFPPLIPSQAPWKKLVGVGSA
jgi:hypothetical protein